MYIQTYKLGEVWCHATHYMEKKNHDVVSHNTTYFTSIGFSNDFLMTIDVTLEKINQMRGNLHQ